MKLALLLLIALLVRPAHAYGTTEAPGAGGEVPGRTSLPAEVLVPEGEAYEDIDPLLENLNRLRVASSVAFSPDGRLASGSLDQTVRLWDWTTGREIKHLEGHTGAVHSVAVSADGQWLASGSADQSVQLWNLRSGDASTRLEGHTDSVYSVAFSPDGRWLASGSADRSVRLWDLTSGRESARLDGHTDWVYSVAFSPDGRWLASGSADRSVRLWDLPSGRESARLDGDIGPVHSVAFSPDGRSLASGAEDKTVRLWDLTTRREYQRLEGHTDWIYAVAFSPDGKLLASGAWDETVRLWDPETGRQVARLEGHTDPVYAIAFSLDGMTLATGSVDNTVRLWDLTTGHQSAHLEGQTNWVFSVAFSPRAEILASASRDGTVRLWDLTTGHQSAPIEGHGGPVYSIAFSPDGQWLASGAEDKTVRVWDLTTGRESERFEGHTDRVYSVAFSPDGKWLASGAADKTVRLWDIATRRARTSRLEGHTRPVRSVAFSPDGKFLASGSEDGTVRLWDLATDHEKAVLEGHTGPVRSIAFSPDGEFLASGSEDGTVRLWDLKTAQEAAPLEGHSDPVYSIAFSPDGRTLASGAWDTVRLWDLAIREVQAVQEGHRNWVLSVAFSPDGTTLASGSGDSTVRVTGKNTARIALGPRGTWVSCSAATHKCWRLDDGGIVVDVDAAGRVRSFPPPGEHQALEVSLEIPTEPVKAGEVLEFPVTIRNRGMGRAYWLQVIPEDTGDTRPWVLESPPVIPFLDPGQAATVRARIHLHPARTNPEHLAAHVRLLVRQVHGDPVPVPPIRARSMLPVLQVSQGRWLSAQHEQAIVVTLENTGSTLSKAAFRIEIPETLQPAEVTLDELAAGGQTTLSFGLPMDLEPSRDLEVRLLGRMLRGPDDRGLPLYDWEFRDLPVAPPGSVWRLYGAALIAVLALATWVYYQRVYRDPTVVRLSHEPSGLLALGSEDLAPAKKRLARAGRLDSVLRATRVQAAWLEGALRWDTHATAGERCRLLAERLGRPFAVPANGTGSPWTIDLGEDFPLNLQRLRVHLPAMDVSAQDVLNRLGIPPEVTLVIGSDPEQRRILATEARTRGGLLVAPSSRELTALLLADHPLDALAGLIARYVPVTQVSPYQTAAGVNKHSLFFGRGPLIAQITGGNPANYLVVGGRQVGKSSLLKAIERYYRNDPRVECHYLVLSGVALTARLAEAMGLPPGTGLDAVMADLHKPREKRVMLLIDEADAFVDEDRKKDYATLHKLRSASEEGRAHFVLAGFWCLYRQAALDYQSPLKNFGRVMTVGALEEEACRNLAVLPMERMHIHWESDDLVTRLITQTGRRANLISIACDDILNVLGPTRRKIHEEHLRAVFAGLGLRDALLGWSEIGDDDSERRRDQIVLYATAPLGKRFSLADLVELLEAHGYSPEPESLKQSLARLELAFVLGREGAEYCYQVPLQRELILTDDTDTLMHSYIEAESRARVPGV